MRRQDHIGNGIPGAHFVEGHLRHRLAVDAGLRLRQPAEDVLRPRLGRRRQRRFRQQLRDVLVVAVVVAFGFNRAHAEAGAGEHAIRVGAALEFHQPGKARLLQRPA